MGVSDRRRLRSCKSQAGAVVTRDGQCHVHGSGAKMNWGSGLPRLPELGEHTSGRGRREQRDQVLHQLPSEGIYLHGAGGTQARRTGGRVLEIPRAGTLRGRDPGAEAERAADWPHDSEPSPKPACSVAAGDALPPAACRGKGRTVPHATAPPRAMRHPVSNIRPKSQAFQRVGSMGKVTDGQEKPASGPVIGAMRLRRQRLVKVLSETDENLENLTRRGK